MTQHTSQIPDVNKNAQCTNIMHKKRMTRTNDTAAECRAITTRKYQYCTAGSKHIITRA